jgi:hypothetical protein
LLEGLIACPVEGDKVPDTSSKLESSREAKQDIIGTDESIFTENGTKETKLMVSIQGSFSTLISYIPYQADNRSGCVN